jgi:hypothetical protein
VNPQATTRRRALSWQAYTALGVVATLALLLRLVALAIGTLTVVVERSACAAEAADRLVGAACGIAPVAARVEAAFLAGVRA